jgi:hypothetical protein
LIPLVGTLCGVLLAVFFFYAHLGVFVFGGKVYPEYLLLKVDNIEKLPIVEGFNNFNDFPSAFITLFELIIVNNWAVTTEIHVLATSKWARLFFLTFWLVAVIIALNLLVAFILDMFNLQVMTRA